MSVTSCSFPETPPGLTSRCTVNHSGSHLPSDALALVSGPHTLWICLLAGRPLLCRCLFPLPPACQGPAGSVPVPVVLVPHALLRQAHLLPRLRAHCYLHDFSRPAELCPNSRVGTEPLMQKEHREVNCAEASTHGALCEVNRISSQGALIRRKG